MINEHALALPICYLPSISWFASAIGKHELILTTAEFYRKENHPNRCSIFSANGIINLNVPLSGGRNQKTRMCELKIAGDDWKRNHLYALKSAYGKAPFFLYYFDELEKIIVGAKDNYFDLCVELIRWLILEMIPSVSITISDIEIIVAKIKLGDCNKYYQVFENKFGFQNNMSAIDLLFCMGPEAYGYLKNQNIKL
ncbi:MAG: hypothetical protein D4R43_03335 [Sphingobacteriales bacterium]|nr:MAG: hypothetical protein D4R43_03335 [Sphingobacteriales bacterium]